MSKGRIARRREENEVEFSRIVAVIGRFWLLHHRFLPEFSSRRFRFVRRRSD